LVSPDDRFVHLEYCRQAPIKLPPGDYTGYNGNVFFAPSADDGPVMPCFSLPWEGEMAAVDGVGSLFRFSPLKGDTKYIEGRRLSGTIQLIATDVLAVNVFNARLTYVGREWPDNAFRIVSIGAAISRNTPLQEKARRAFFGPVSKLAHPEFGLLALEQNEFQWIVIYSKGQQDLVKPYGATVFGVMIDARSVAEPALLALEDDLQTVSLNGRNWRKEILRAHAQIKHIALCQREPYIAYSTVDGEIVVYSVDHRADLCRYSPEGEK
jgi:hypothetical protein